VRRLIPSIAPLLLVLSANAQQTTPITIPITEQQAKQLSWLDYTLWATCSIGTVETDKNTHKKFFFARGTGVLVRITSDRVYLVTAKHVFDEPEKNWHPNELRLRFKWQEDKSVFDELGIPLTFKDARGNPLWAKPSDGSDIAAVAAPSDIHDLNRIAIFPEAFAKEEDLYQGGSVVVLGYPGFVGNEYLVRAILRQGIVAWTSPIDPLKRPFMVDANLYPGNSGGPVMHVPGGIGMGGRLTNGGKPTFLGIVSQAKSQEFPVILNGRPLTVQQQGGILTVPVIGGIGMIEPAGKILDFLQSIEPKK